MRTCGLAISFQSCDLFFLLTAFAIARTCYFSTVFLELYFLICCCQSRSLETESKNGGSELVPCLFVLVCLVLVNWPDFDPVIEPANDDLGIESQLGQ